VATEIRLDPNAQGTRGTWTTFAAGTTNLHLACDDYTGGGAHNSDTDGVMGPNNGDSSLFLLLEDTPADFDPTQISSISVKSAYRKEEAGVSGSADSVALFYQVFRSDETTAITTELSKGAITSTSYAEATDALTGTGSHTKTDWDGARLRIRQDYTVAGCADTTTRLRVTAVEIVVVYTANVTATTAVGTVTGVGFSPTVTATANTTASTALGTGTIAGLAPMAYGSPPAIRLTSASQQGLFRTTAPNYNAGPYTFAGWVYLTTVAADQNFAAINESLSAYDVIRFKQTEGTLNLQTAGGSSTVDIFDGADAAMTSATWYYIAMVRHSSTVIKAYIGTTAANVALVHDGTGDTTGRAAADLISLGFVETGSVGPVNGRVEAWKLYTRALTEAELRTEAEYYEPQDTADIWAAWRLDDLTTGIQDVTGNGRDLTVLNGPLILESGIELSEPAAGTTVTPGAGTATAAGLSPTVLTPRTVTPAVGTVDAAGLVPIALTPVTVTPALGTVDAAGLAPTVSATANVTATPALGDLTAAGLAPTVTATAHVTATPALGDVTATGLEPTVTTGANTTATPALGEVTAAGLAPTVTATTNTLASTATGDLTAAGLSPTVTATTNALAEPGTGEVTATGLAPTAEGGAGVTANTALGELTAAGLAPTVTATDHQTAATATGQATLAGLAPTIQTPVTVAPALGDVTATGLAPTITLSVQASTATGAATIAGLAPTVQTPRTATPGLGTVTATGLEPTVLAPVTVVSATGELDATGFAPVVTATTNTFARPGVGVLALAGLAPDIDTGQITVEPGTGILTLRGFRPQVTATVTLGIRLRRVSPADAVDLILGDGRRRGRPR
jgi:hypothetical protein